MAFARFNQCQPCCECRFTISTTTAGSGLAGVTITVRDVFGSGVGSCVTTESGCSVAITKVGNYYVHNSFCNTTQLVNIARCGNAVTVAIPNIAVTMTANSECFFDAPETNFVLTGPLTNFSATASGNVLIGTLPFLQLAARAFLTGARASGVYTLTVSDVEDNHYPSTVNSDIFCLGKDISTYMIKKWGYTCAPGATIDFCHAPGVVISDSDGHTATTDSNGFVHDKWKYDFPNEIPTTENSYTTISVEKAPYISPCPDGCLQPKPRCRQESECADTLGPFNLSTPDGFWGSPTDECIEEQPDTLTVTTNGFSMVTAVCSGSVQVSSTITNTVTVSKDSPYVSFPYNYAWPQTGGLTDPYECGNLINVACRPGCRKDASGFLGGIVTISNAIDPGPPASFLAPFPDSTRCYTDVVGTSACPTLFTVTEYNNFTHLPTGRSVTVSA